MENISEVVERYCSMKTEVNSYTKQLNADNEAIKNALVKAKLDEFSSDNFTVKYSVTVSEGFDEDKLLAKLKELSAESVIKTKEYVDMEALENAIYNGKINAADLADCKTRKETPKLTFKKKKEAK